MLMLSRQAGSLESGDLLVDIRRKPSPGVSVQLTSPVKAQFGERIEQVISEALSALALDGVEVLVRDRGALDYVVSARVRTAAERLLAAERSAADPTAATKGES